MNKPRIFWSIFLFILMTTNIVKAVELDFHKPIPCIGCHKETLDADAGDGDCGDCHQYRGISGGINVPMMEEQHNPKICRACHIGNTATDANEKELFHNAHSSVKCDQCHVSGNASEGNSTIIKIEAGKAFQCTSCHGNKIHSIHVKKLNDGCPICHGSWAAGKIYRGEASFSQDKSQENANYEKFTIFAFIKNLFNALIGIK